MASSPSPLQTARGVRTRYHHLYVCQGVRCPARSVNRRGSAYPGKAGRLAGCHYRPSPRIMKRSVTSSAWLRASRWPAAPRPYGQRWRRPGPGACAGSAAATPRPGRPASAGETLASWTPGGQLAHLPPTDKSGTAHRATCCRSREGRPCSPEGARAGSFFGHLLLADAWCRHVMRSGGAANCWFATDCRGHEVAVAVRGSHPTEAASIFTMPGIQAQDGGSS